MTERSWEPGPSGAGPGGRTPLHARTFSPAQVFALGFLGLIALGTMLLALPFATHNGQGLPLIDALFTATSAVCVTGLVVVDTAQTFSPFGQAVIAGLIQIGGFGVMILSTAVALLVGKRITLRERLMLQEAMGQYAPAGVVRLARQILQLTLVVEGAGALLLWFAWLPSYPPGQALWLAVFHSISAFNNAGFDLFSTSLRGFAGRPDVLGVIAVLVILGGLGFTVIQEAIQGRRNLRWERLSLHARVALLTTAGLLTVGTVVYLALEWSNPNTLAALSPWQRLPAALFQATTPRTAGFEAVPTSALTQASQLFTIILMIIGASPGGTGGGIKTTTFAAVALATWSVIRGRDEVVVAGRRVHRDVLRKAWATAAVALQVLMLVTLVLLVTENRPLMAVIFETTSAFATVGLSTGLTPELTVVGKALIALTMYVGRVGPLTILMAVASSQPAGRVQYPDERVMIG